MTLAVHAAPVAMVAIGHAAHLLKKFVEVRQQAPKLSLAQHLAGRPYKTALAVLGSGAGYLLLIDGGGAPDLAAAFGVGYAADSMLEVVGARGRAA